MQKPIQRVKFTKAIARHAKIRDQNLSLLMSVAPTLQNLRIGLKKRQSGKSKVPAKQHGGWPKELKFKEKNKATFFSPSENRCLPAFNVEA